MIHSLNYNSVNPRFKSCIILVSASGFNYVTRILDSQLKFNLIKLLTVFTRKRLDYFF